MSKYFPCIYCTDDLHCTKFAEPDYESWCVLGPCSASSPCPEEIDPDEAEALEAEALEAFADTLP